MKKGNKVMVNEIPTNGDYGKLKIGDKGTITKLLKSNGKITHFEIQFDKIIFTGDKKNSKVYFINSKYFEKVD